LVKSPLRRDARRTGRVLIIGQNPVPGDRRVWFEALALRDAGFAVTVISQKRDGDPSVAELDGVRLRKYAPPPPTRGAISFAWEFAYCWVRTLIHTFRAAVSEGFDVIQACNPPDTYWAVAAPFKLFRKRFVFDQHDLCPELYESRFSNGSRLTYRTLRFLERVSYRLADHVVATNESYRQTATERGRLPEDRVTVVRTGPDPGLFRRRDPAPHWKNGRPHLCAYVGLMGPQDGVDFALHAVASLVRSGRDDIQFVFIGEGDSQSDLVALARDLGLDGHVTFTGYVPDETVFEVLSTADIGLSPDPTNPLNDVSTMTKTMEYMAFGLPVVAFDLKETRVSAQEAAVYATPNDTEEYGRTIAELLDDPERRARMSRIGRERVEQVLAWKHQAAEYVKVFERWVK
jgi:glycosyltransferase involved in cell wall biosynthesis